MMWSMLWAGVTAWLSMIVMCYTVGPNWEDYLQATSSYVVSAGRPFELQPRNFDCITGMVHGRCGLDVRWWYLGCSHDDGPQRKSRAVLQDEYLQVIVSDHRQHKLCWFSTHLVHGSRSRLSVL